VKRPTRGHKSRFLWHIKFSELSVLLLSPLLSDYLEDKEFREIVSTTCESKIHFVIISFSHPCSQQYFSLFYFIFPKNAKIFDWTGNMNTTKTLSNINRNYNEKNTISK
jgi:hypothetical protein